ncbi:MAG: acyltransferase [Kiritimatiellia bacterium]
MMGEGREPAGGFAGKVPGAAGLLMRRSRWRRCLAACGAGTVIGEGARVIGAGNVSIGSNVIMAGDSLISARDGGKISIGDNVFIGKGSELRAAGGVLKIVSGANIGSRCVISAEGAIEIGPDVLIAAYGELKSSESRLLSVGGGCWLGVRVRVTASVSIGSGSIIGAHSVVTEDIPSMAIAYGNPAKVMRRRT